jgi:hypothetical protein
MERKGKECFGVDTKTLIDDFLYFHYELNIIHHKTMHTTMNLSIEELKKAFGYRLTDRFKSYNVMEGTREKKATL